MTDVLIHRLDADLPLPRYAKPGDAGADLYSRIDIDIAPGARALVPTGIAIALGPCTATSAISKRTCGQRFVAFVTTSCSASLLRPQISPMQLGRTGSGRFRSGANSPSAVSSARSFSNRMRSSPTPTTSGAPPR